MNFIFKDFKSNVIENNFLIITTDKFNKDDLNKLTKDLLDHNIDNYLKNENYTGSLNQKLSIPTGKNKIKKITFFGVGNNKKFNEKILKEAGAKLFDLVNQKSQNKVSIYFDTNIKAEERALVLFGFKIRSFIFNKYITKKKEENTCYIEEVTFLSNQPTQDENAYIKYIHLAEGVALSKNLISEPPNYLYPETFAQRCIELEKFGLKVEVLTSKEMQQLGMGALLGVAQGSTKEARLVVMKWNGSSKREQPLAFVGKGVTFDTGGLSLKPANFMKGMKYDMAGAGVVTGLMKTLALRKAKINAIGVIGLVENMPDGNAQRPEDIVTSMSGQTIEVLNTDAEGRLVLADALWYTQEKYTPKLIIDLATLTGAIIITLADKYAGLFSNNDKLSTQLTKAGIQTDEKLWRFPLSEEYDKMIDSKIADMQNISNGHGAGSITAAQFLQRFIKNNTPWAHIDIAGVDNLQDSPLHKSGATAFGVQLLNKFIEDNYE